MTHLFSLKSGMSTRLSPNSWMTWTKSRPIVCLKIHDAYDSKRLHNSHVISLTLIFGLITWPDPNFSSVAKKLPDNPLKGINKLTKVTFRLQVTRMTREMACGFCKFFREVLSIKSYSTELAFFPLYTFLFRLNIFIYFKTKISKYILKLQQF